MRMMMQWEDSGVTPVCRVLSTGEIWVKHYSSNHKILLVGEGDFSFSLSLALRFGSASNIFATSLDSSDTLRWKYTSAESMVAYLVSQGATIFHGVDATKLKDRINPYNYKFDRIVYNFPHAGFFGKEDNPELIKMHQNLVRGFFNSARCFLRENGEIHVSHKNKAPYRDWNLEQLALENSLFLIEAVPFNITDYPFYQNKRGDGSDSDSPFDLGDCSTFKFGMNFVKLMVKVSVTSVYPRATRYGCALFNQHGSQIAITSGPLHEACLDAAALRAIREGLLMFERSKLCGKAGLVVITDSRTAVSWIKSDMGNPWEAQRIIEEIRMAVDRIGNVDFPSSDGEFGVRMQQQRLAVADELRVDMKSTVELWF